jgi:anti-anti-sigma factor
MGLELIEEKGDRIIIVIARGRLDSNTSQVFGARLEKLTSLAEPRVVLDFAVIEFMSSAGLRVILALHKRVRAARGMLTLCAVQAPVREVLDITGFADMLGVHSARADAISALA